MSKKWLFTVMATVMVCTLGLGTACFNNQLSPGGNKPPIDSSSTVEPSISLNMETARMSVYDTLQLTATTENGEGDIEWTSSNLAVAMVDENGLVTGVGEGLVTITATYSGKTATCQITITTSTEVPVMTVSATNVSLNKDDTYTVSISTTWKGVEVQGVEYNWFLEDETLETSSIAAIAISEDTKSATFTGIGKGTEFYTVYARVNGLDLTETISVKVVDNNIRFTSANLTRGAEAYEANISLAESEGHIQSIVPEISVYYKGVLRNDATINFTNNNPEIAQMAQDGTITVLKEGVAMFTAEVSVNGSTEMFNLRVNAYRPEILIDTVTIETGRTDKTLSLGDLVLQGEVNSVKISDSEVFAAYKEGIITLDGAALPSKTAELGEGKTLIIETEKAKYKATANVYSLVLRSKADFALMGDVAYAADDNVWIWGGYFVLGNDIDMDGGSYQAIFGYGELTDIQNAGNKSNGGNGYRDPRYHGFHGVFDGKGYEIQNMNQIYWFGGLFPVFGGTFRNVAFTHLTVKGQASPICDIGSGTIENVYIQVDEVLGETHLFCQQSSYNDLRINNCFVDLPETIDQVFSLGIVNNGYGVVNGVYAVGAKTDFKYASSAGDDSIRGSYSTYANLLANENFSTWEGDFWTLVDGIPVPNGVEVAGNCVYDAETSIGISDELEIGGKYVKVQLSENAIASGITLNANSIIIPNDDLLKGKAYTVRVSNYFDVDSYKEFTFYVRGMATYVLETEKQRVNLNSASTSFDFSSVAGNIQGTLAGVEINGVALDATYKNNTLMVDMTKLGNVYGENTLVAEFRIMEGSEVVSFEKVYVSVHTVREIETAEQFLSLSNYLAMDGKDGYAELYVTKDIDMQGATVRGVGTYSNGWTHYFTGIFDGQNHVISNFTVTGNSRGGLFCSLKAGSKVKNLVFYNVFVNGYASAIAMENSGTIKNVFVYGQIAQGGRTDPASFIVGKNKTTGVMQNCVVVCDGNAEMGDCHRGMLAGWSQGVIEDCVAINLSGSEIYGINTKRDKDSDLQGETSGNENLVAQNYDEYVSKAAEVTYDDWATTYIQKILNENKGASVGVNEMTLGSEQQIVANTTYVKSYNLAKAVNGVSVSDTGLITVAENAATKTSFEVIVTYIDGTKQTLTLSTLMTTQKIELNQTPIDIDAREIEVVSYDFAGQDLTVDQIKNILVNNVVVPEESIAISGSIVSIPAEFLEIGENTIVYECHTEDTIYNASYKVIKASMIISDKAELQEYRAVVMGGKHEYTKITMDGYYILDADIEYDAHWYFNFNYTNAQNSGLANAWNGYLAGFRGTFDGRGHYIDGLSFTYIDQGFFGIIGQNGVVKNVAFTNVTLDRSDSILASLCSGRIENVYVEINNIPSGGHSAEPIGLIGKHAYQEARLVNVFVDVKASSVTGNNGSKTDGTSILGVWHEGYGSIENALVVTSGADAWDKYDDTVGAGAKNNVKAYTTRAEMAEKSNEWTIDGWGDCWTTDADGLPIFKSVKNKA